MIESDITDADIVREFPSADYMEGFACIVLAKHVTLELRPLIDGERVAAIVIDEGPEPCGHKIKPVRSMEQLKLLVDLLTEVPDA